jgi:hypothetical protein
METASEIPGVDLVRGYILLKWPKVFEEYSGEK